MNKKANLRNRPAIWALIFFLAGTVWNCATVCGEAQPAVPADGAVITGDTLTYMGDDYIYTPLIFIPGATAVKHTGYFSDNYDDVANRAEDANLGPPPIGPLPWVEYRYVAGHPSYPPADDSLVRGTVYYWTVDATDALGNTFLGDVWEFGLQGFEAFVPSPPNEAIVVDTSVLLSWWPGFGVTEHDVYIGTDFDDVNNARYNYYNQLPVFLDTVSEPNILVTSLEFNTKYYWRVDEVHNRLPPPFGGNYYYGDVWCFTILPEDVQPDFPADGEVIVGEFYPPGPYPTHIYTPLDFIPSSTAVKHTAYFSDNYDDVANRIEDANLGEPPEPTMPNRYYVGHPSYPPIDNTLIRETVYYWCVDETDALGNTSPGEIWEFGLQGFHAFAPSPPNDAILVDTSVLLSWWPGFGVTEHDVYFGTNFDDVNNAMFHPYNPSPVFLDTVSEPNILVTGLSFNTKYYWRVDEISGRFPPPLAAGTYYLGDVWCFTILHGDAQAEFPADEEVIPGETVTYMGVDYIWTRLIFIPGATAVEHTGYFSEDYNKVAGRDEDAKFGSPPYAYVPGWEYTFIAGNPQVPPADDILVRGRTYYWTVDETDAQGRTFAGDIWEFTILGFYAFAPNPPDEAVDVDTTLLLSWLPGFGVQNHDVYMGTSWDDVNNAVYDYFNPPLEFLGNVSEPNILVTDLVHEVKYYWRVDEVSGRDLCPPLCGGVYYKGDVWSFTTEAYRIFVDTRAGGANNGESWEDAYNYLQDALIEAAPALKPVEIRVAEGTYTPDRSAADPNGSGIRSASFGLINGVTIKGGYAGFGESNPDARDIKLYETILSGDLDGNDVDVNDPADLLNDPTREDNSYIVVLADNTDVTSVLDGFTITACNGKFSFPPPPLLVTGGMCNLYANPTVTNCTFTANAGFGGSGMYNLESNPALLKCTFTNNYRSAMYNQESSPTVTNCIFSRNWTEDYGGGMYNYKSSPTVTNCTFTDNTANSNGGGIYNRQDSNSRVINCIVWNNLPDQIVDHSSTSVVTYSDVQGGWAGDGNIDADPCFVDAAAGNFRLSSDSPCIDAGYNNAPNLPAMDFDGHPRIIDGDCNDTEVVDMGAFEFNYAYMGDFDYDCSVDFVDLSIFGLAWTSQPGDINWDFACNISIPADNVIDRLDLAAFADNWLAGF
ncbi:MAG: right-handed parallel beta-helix repeat-containing protein [Planctomycetota bacterium]